MKSRMNVLCVALAITLVGAYIAAFEATHDQGAGHNFANSQTIA